MKYFILFFFLACGYSQNNTIALSYNDSEAQGDLIRAVDALNQTMGCEFLEVSNYVEQGQRFVSVVYSEKETVADFNGDRLGAYHNDDHISYYTKDKFYTNAGALILMHEIGHALGLQHTDYPGLMQGSRDYNRIDFTLFDAGVSFVYELRQHAINPCPHYN